MSRVLMKVFSSSLLFVFFISCLVNKKNNLNQSENLVGKFNVEQLLQSTHNKWYKNEYDSYEVDKLALSYFTNYPEKLSHISVKIFLGTWCSDSHREVPRIIKILKYLNFSTYELIGLDENKTSPAKHEYGLDIEFVPTIIFFENEKEINRIIETPKKTLERDIVDIL